MTDISFNKVTKNFGTQIIFKDLSFEIKTGEIVSLIGENGAGKSTILKMIMKDELPTSGSIAIRKDLTIGYLSQDICMQKNIKVLDLLYKSFSNIKDMETRIKQYEDLMQGAIGDKLNKLIIKYTNLQDRFIIAGGYEIEEKLEKIVNGFKIKHLLNSLFNDLSGGEQRIVLFATLILNSPDILLLDEPTNHLDIEALEWLENYLNNYKGTIIIVSHDRYFLDKVSKKIMLLDRGSIDIYFGNYSYYLEEYDRRVLLDFKDYNDQQRLIKKMKESIKKLYEFGKLAYPNGESFFKRAKAIEKRLEKIELLAKPKNINKIPLSFNMKNRSGNDVLIINDLNIAFTSKVIFEHANMSIYYGDHICLIGKNGSGKSTLIKEIIKGNNNIKLGSNINIGYISQEIIFDSNKRVIDIAKYYFNGEEEKLRSALFRFMFVGDAIYKKTSILSGGEKVRLKLFCLMQNNINFLILDEPTNHIDITTREVLEETLNNYKGTILFVSHDRYFINKVASKIYSIENNKLNLYHGNYEDYKINISKKEN